MRLNKIGGEFEIDPGLFSLPGKYDPKGYLLSSGRAALDVILAFLREKKGINEILLPDYLCESILTAAEKNSFKISFYKLNRDFELDLLRFPDKLKDKAILVINYFGLKKTDETISFLKNNTENCSIILDNVQAFSEIFNHTAADFSFASFRKFFPVPDGGWLLTNDASFIFDKPVKQSLFYKKKLAGGILKYYSSFVPLEDETYLRQFEEGENELDNSDSISSISDVSRSILSKLQYRFEESFSQRNTNAAFILEGLKHLEIDTLFPVNKVINAPLAIPVTLKNRDLIRKKLFESKVYVPIHWPVPVKYFRLLETGKIAAQTELSLIIDQRYCPDNLQRILYVLHECKNENLL